MQINVEFIEKLRRKDKEAVKIFLNEFKVPLYNYIYRFVYNRHDAEDILQEVFLKIFKNISKIDFSKNYKSFIYRLTKNATLDFLKNKKDEHELDKEAICIENSPYEKLQTKDRIEKALRCISQEEREIIVLKYVQEFKISEISEMLKLSESAVKVRIFRAIRKIKNMHRKNR